MNEAVGAVTVFITIVIYGFYIRDTLRGTIKPHPFSWLLWLIIMFVIFLAQVSDGAGPGAWMNGVVTIMNFIIFVISLKGSALIIKKFDVFILVLACVAITLWILTSNPFLSVIILSVANTLAYIPTYRKSFAKPFEEPLYIYGINFFRHALAIVALANYSIVTALSPAILVLNNFSIFLFLYYRRRVVAS